jgi:hypothetical protein
MWRRIVLWAGVHRSLAMLAAAVVVLVVAAAALAVALMQSSQRPPRAASSLQQGSQPRPRATGRTAPTAPVVSSLAAVRCGAQASEVSVARRVARRLVVEFMAYSLGRLGSHPPFPDATAEFRQAIWGMSHSPPPALAGVLASVTLIRAKLTGPGVVVARFTVRIDRPGLTSFPLLVVVSLRGCRWLAGGF